MEVMEKVKTERSFGGILVTAENYRTLDPEQRKLENKHLKAYLKGKEFFRHGYTEMTNEYGMIERVPAIYFVKQNLK